MKITCDETCSQIQEVVTNSNNQQDLQNMFAENQQLLSEVKKTTKDKKKTSTSSR